MPNKPSMDVYYKQGPSAYGFEMAKFAYEQGERDPNKLTWIDQAGGLLSYLDYLKGQPDVVEYAEKPTWITGTEGGPAGAAGPDYFKLGKTTTFEATPQGVMKTVNKPTGSFKIPNVLAGQSGITTTDFATAYKTKFGVAPSQTELNTFISQRKTTPLETIISNMAGITPESLETAKKINLPGETADFTQANAMVAGVSSLQNLINQLTPEDTTADKSKQDLLNKMASQTEELAKKSADQLTAEQSAGLPQLKQQFADINAQILSKMAEYKVLIAQEEGKPITMSSIIGATAQIAKVKASEIGLLQAQAQGLQGQITVAQDTVNRAIDLKYSTIENQLEVYQAQLNALEPELNKEEKIQALAQQLLIDKYKQQVSDAKTEEQNIQKVMLEAIEKGITDTNVLNQISASSSYSGALEVLGKSMPEETPKISTTKTEWLEYLSTSGIDIINKTDAQLQVKAKEKGLMGFNDYATFDANRKRSISTTNIITPETYDEVKTILENTKGSDGYVNTDEYKKQRNLAKDKASFDKNYGYMLNPNDPTAQSFLETKGMTATTIDSQTKADLLEDIKMGASLTDLYNAYNDVSPSLIQSLYYNQ